MTIEPDALRMMERLIVTVFGGISLVLGYWLFRHGIVESQSGEIKILDRFHLTATRMGPGIFFALFGCAVLVTSLVEGIVYTTTSEATGEPATSSAAKGHGMQRSFTGHVQRQSYDPRFCLKAINTAISEFSATGPDQSVSDDRQRVLHGLRQAAAHMLGDAFIERIDLVSSYLGAVTAGEPLETVTSDPHELALLREIEAAYTEEIEIDEEDS